MPKPIKEGAERRKSPEARGYPRVYLGRDTQTNERLLALRGVSESLPKGYMTDDQAVSLLLDAYEDNFPFASLRRDLLARFGLDPALLDEILRRYGMPPE